MDCVLRDMIIQASCRRWRKAVTTRVEAEAVVDVLLRFRVEPWLDLERVLVCNLVVPAVERLGVVARRRDLGGVVPGPLREILGVLPGPCDILAGEEHFCLAHISAKRGLAAWNPA